MSLINCPTPAVTYRGRILCPGGKVTVERTRRTYDQNTSEYLIDLETGCWVWQRAKTKAGYGQVPIDGKMLYAHRVYYENNVGPIPEGLVLDHLCKNPACCNPDHLEPVTQAENMRRRRRPSCSHGHEMTGDNVYVTPAGNRQCRECNRARARDRVRLEGIAHRERRASKAANVEGSSLTVPTRSTVPLGKCQCGCGADTSIAKKTVSAKGIVKGRPMRYLRGHASSWRETGGYAIDKTTGCWVWQRSTSFQGYGQVWNKGKLHRAHRVFYELHRGPIPDGLQIDHTCGNRLCVNPDHLEPVTPIENTWRAMRREP
jgi:hypothetical protein